MQLQDMIDKVPNLTSGRVATHAEDDHGKQLGALDPVADPAGGYIGVYHSQYGTGPGRNFKINLGHSNDLLRWTRTRILDSTGASMPTLQPIPGTRGYLLAYEKVLAHGRAIRLVYYRSRAALIAGRPSLQTDLPRRFSPYSNGTPTILSVAWHGSPVRSVIQLGFHYELQVNGRPGPDREAIGIVSGFYQWRTSKDQSADQALSAQGLPGSHGGWRQFTYNDYQWRVYEAQRQFNSFATWHLILYNPVSHAAYPLSLHLGDSRMTSAGNPTVSVQAAPGRRAALVVTAFVFRAPSRTLTRELIYYQPISS